MYLYVSYESDYSQVCERCYLGFSFKDGKDNSSDKNGGKDSGKDGGIDNSYQTLDKSKLTFFKEQPKPCRTELELESDLNYHCVINLKHTIKVN